MKKFTIIALLSFQAIFAQVKFEAKALKETYGINEKVRVEFSMNVDGDYFTPPGFEGFIVVSGPSQSVTQTWVNGKSTFTKKYTYYLSANEKGVFTIGESSIENNGQVYKTQPVTVIIGDAVAEIKEDPKPDFFSQQQEPQDSIQTKRIEVKPVPKHEFKKVKI